MNNNTNYNGMLNKEAIVLLQNDADKILKKAVKRIDLEARAVSKDLVEYVAHSEKKLNFHPDVPIIPLQNGEFGYFTNSNNVEGIDGSSLKNSVGKIQSNYDKPVVPSENGEHKYFGKK